MTHRLRVLLVVAVAAAVPLALQAQQFPPPLDQPQQAPAPKAAKKKKQAPAEQPPVVNLPVDPDGPDQPAPAGPAQAARARPAQPPHAVACTGLFAKDSSHLKLATVYGAQNVTFAEVDGPQNSKLMASVLYPKDPKRHLEVLWNNEAARTDTSLVVINGQSTWTGPKGLRLGLAIAALEKLNGKPFQLAGFDQDNAGAAVDWQGGAFDKVPGGCKIGVRTAPDPKAPESARTAAAGKILMSSDAVVRAVQPKIVEIIIGY
jgi:hypothetical protein